MPLRDDALQYHSARPAGKLEITPTKSCSTLRDLALSIGLVSGGFIEVVAPLASDLGIRYAHGNRLADAGAVADADRLGYAAERLRRAL